MLASSTGSSSLSFPSSSALHASTEMERTAVLQEYVHTFTDRFQDTMITFLPGAAQGCTTILIGHPLDTAKTRMQAVGPNAQQNPAKTIFTMMRQEGFKSVYRGVVPPLLMEGTKRSLQFALYDTFRSCRKADKLFTALEQEAGAADLQLPLKERLRRRAVHVFSVIGSNPFLSGAVAGGLGTIIGCPMHVIKIQTQNQTSLQTRNAFTCSVQIYQQDGFKGFYRGLKYNLIKDICFAGAYLGMFSIFKDYLRSSPITFTGNSADGSSYSSRNSISNDSDTNSRKERFLWRIKRTFRNEKLENTRYQYLSSNNTSAFIAGASASMITWTLLYPLDTLKTIVQSRRALDLSQLLRQPRMLYRGLSASLLKAGPVSGGSMLAYDYTKRCLEQWKEDTKQQKRGLWGSN